MKKIVIFLILSYLSTNIVFCQLLSKPSLTVEDFEKALTNDEHLKKILKKHNFEYSELGETKPGYINKLSSSYRIINPLVPDIRAYKSEDWILKNQGDIADIKINLFEWEPNHAPQPEVIKTIRVMILRNSIYAEKMDKFLEEIKNNYPNKSQRYFQNSELYKEYGEPLIVFTNNSKIEVRTETADTSYGPFYSVSFDLVK